MKIKLLLSILIFQCSYSFSQTISEHFSVVATSFKKIELPYTIDCKDLISETNPGFDFISYIDSFPYYSDSNNQLTRTQFDSLFQSVDSLEGHNIWSLDPCCIKSKEDFYNSYLLIPGAFFEIEENVLGFIIWIIDEDGIQKVLYTMDHNLNILGKLPLAFYCRHGSYTEDDGSKGVWWTTKSAVILEDLKVKTDAGHHKEFQIKKNGEIEKI